MQSTCNTTSVLNYLYRLDIWNALYSLIIYAIQSKPSNLMFRLTLRFPEITYDAHNDHIVGFMKGFEAHLDGNGNAPLYLWVKEYSYDSHAGNFHYHLWLILDGRKIRNPFLVLGKAIELWGLAIRHDASGLVHLDELNVPGSYTPHGVMIRKVSREFGYLMSHVWDKAQYLAKSYSKEFYPYMGRSFGVSAIPRLPESDSRAMLFRIMSGR